MKLTQLKRIVVAGLIGFSVLGAGSVPVLANTQTVVATAEDSEKNSIAPFADVLHTHFRTVNGILQYRIWNATRFRWENDWTVL